MVDKSAHALRKLTCPWRPLRLVVLVLISLRPLPLLAEAPLPRIAVAEDGRGFVEAATKHPFRPWGLNYGNQGRLIEDFWQDEWQTIADDFAEIKQLGGNVVRVHLQFGKFMKGADEPNPATFEQLNRLLKLAESTGLYLDLTGLACYRPGDTPAWYDALDDDARWAAQAVFWTEVARHGAASTAVFCYDLMNEPVSPAGKGEKWYSGNLFGGFDFVQYIARDPAGRSRGEIATAWIDRLSAAIRKHDRQALITVGLLPWGEKWKHLSGFIPEEIAPHVDFISVHLYPKRKLPDDAFQALEKCVAGKPILIEETFPLECSVPEWEAFLRQSRKHACGWVFHYDGRTIAEYDELERAGELTLAQAIWRASLLTMQKLRPEFRTTAAAATATD